jgi:hypothetical protein
MNLDNTDSTNPIYADAILAEEKRRMQVESARLGRPLRTDEKLTIITNTLRDNGLSPSLLPLAKVLTDQSFDPGIPGYTGYTLPGALDTPDQRAAIDAANAAKIRADLKTDVVQSVAAPFTSFYSWLPWLLAGAAAVFVLAHTREAE